MPKLPPLTPKQLLSILQKEGFEIDHATGSHYILYHSSKKLRVTIPFHRKDLPRRTPRICPAPSRTTEAGPVSGATTSLRRPRSAWTTRMDTTYVVSGLGSGRSSTSPKVVATTGTVRPSISTTPSSRARVFTLAILPATSRVASGVLPLSSYTTRACGVKLTSLVAISHLLFFSPHL
ncbi:MAG: type II toxin-antitoxin system HicA family toxin [Candidatus Wildermuthbacteria bacterium]|nr:type II toxin-antitoxin system HicA family toxin [Candidatus Wildermuthbacteria bacterium]